MQLLIQVVLLIVGFTMLIKGADWFVEGAAGIADRFGISQLIIGLTIVAMGTSMPEAAVSITSVLKGSEGITIGNVIGSNIMNVLLILGVTAVIAKVAVQNSTVKVEMPFMLAITVVLLACGMTGQVIGRFEGGLLWVLFILYLGYLFWMAKKQREEAKEPEKKKNLMFLIFWAIFGGALVVWGADVTVDAATEIATAFGMSDRLIGLTIVAFGTSLPELVTSATAAFKGKTDIAIGNIVGSNVFNILFVTGTTALIMPVVFERAFLIDGLVSFAAGVLLWLGVVKTKALGRPMGCVMLAAYAGYFVYLLMG